MVMRRTLGTTLLLLALLTGAAGCGDETDAGSPAPAGPGSSEGPDTPVTNATIVYGTAVKGDLPDQVIVLADRSAVRQYAARFTGSMSEKIQQAAAGIEVSDAQRLVAGVVAIGCDVPPSVDVVGQGDDVRFEPAKVPSPHPECLAPVTTVALAAVPA
jgi:hypothetical protein